MRPSISKVFGPFVGHWGKLVFLILLGAGGAAILLVPPLQAGATVVWKGVLTWAGLAEAASASDTVYWCPMHPQIRRNKPNEVCPICNMALEPFEGDASAGPAEQLTLTPQQVQQVGVEYEPVIRRRLYREIDTTGRVEYDERRLAKLTSWVRGKSRIEKLYVQFTGERVQKGALLAELYSGELIASQEAYAIALESKSRFGDVGLLESARQNLLDQGLTQQQIDQFARNGKIQDRVPIYAPFSGTVLRRHVQEGNYVSEGEVLFEISDLTHLWLLADIYEEELPLVHEGQQATINVRSLAGETFDGIVSFIDPELQRDTRTIRLRIDVENPQRLLKPGMYARVQLRKELGEKLAVPANAVLWTGERQVAIVHRGEGIFQPREVRLDTTWAYPSDTPPPPYQGGARGGGGQLEFGQDRVRYHPVLAGLNPGEQVVTAGAFLLNAESQLKSVLTKMLPPQSETATLEEAVGPQVAGAIRQVLDAYYGLSGALADDDLEAVPRWAVALGKGTDVLARRADEAELAELSGTARRLAELADGLAGGDLEDLRAVRVEFGRISRGLVALLAENGGQTLFGNELFLFRCGMAKVGYENWLWWSSEIHNPYMGQKMLSCGTPLETLEP